eukprot:7785-Heterococcus_DN1.PRE.2
MHQYCERSAVAPALCMNNYHLQRAYCQNRWLHERIDTLVTHYTKCVQVCSNVIDISFAVRAAGLSANLLINNTTCKHQHVAECCALCNCTVRLMLNVMHDVLQSAP